jgi:anti-sigma B factor antagonist
MTDAVSEPDEFSVESTVLGRTLVVRPTGELDLSTVDDVRTALADRPAGIDTVVLDLRGLSFFDSSGMRLVVETMQQADAEGLAFALVRGTQAVQRLFEVARMDDRLPFVDGLDELDR